MYLKSNALVQGSVEDIRQIMCLGTDRNLVQAFFKGKDIEQARCVNCQEAKNLQRCHSIIDRPKIMQNAVEALHSDDTKPIGVKDILIQFLEFHKTCPLYWLCLDCHNRYSKLS